ncbi:MAG: glutaminyl-peptide cyclotransferase [Mucilaginibacter polytrichastri]|nr:glutaminyl-peptide cyclotransferase [Mucilaginibacter polytrichastri]
MKPFSPCFFSRPVFSSAFFTLLFCVLLLAACGEKKGRAGSGLSFISPEQGENFDRGDTVKVAVSFSGITKVDSIVYLVDSARFAASRDTLPITFRTDSLALGARLITARVYSGGKTEEISTNIILFAEREPEILGYKVVREFPHDTSAYTQGLEFHDGVFYESAGGNRADGVGVSSLRKVQPETGKVLQRFDLDPDVFAEGLAVNGNTILQLTWQNREGYVYDRTSFKRTGTFAYQSSPEGWGLCFDGKRYLKSDGSNRIWFLNKDDYHEEGSIEVYDFEYPVDQLNELEYINGKIYANIYQKDTIAVINPRNGEVEQKIDLKGILPQNLRAKNTDVLNGIAYDEKTRRLFVTGKKWPRLYQIELVKK